MIAKKIVNAGVFYIIASVLAVFALLPFIWMISTSFKTEGTLMSIPIQWIPNPISFDAYRTLFELFPFARAFVNTSMITVGSTCIALLSSLMAAYIFAKVEFKGREVVFALYLATMMIPSQVVTIPMFLILKELLLINTFAGLMLPSLFKAFSVFLMRQHIMNIHNDYLDAASMDGANRFHIFLKIILPLCMPIILTLTVLTVMEVWGDYFWPLIVLTEKEKMTLTLALSQLNGQYGSKYNILMAGSLISMVPIIILYLFAQKYFKEGLQLGGVK